jgi:hypothetical protein
MRYLLMTTHGRVHGVPPRHRWSTEDQAAHDEYLTALREELVRSGELVGAFEPARPEAGKLVVGDGVNPPVVRDWPFEDLDAAVSRCWVVEVSGLEQAMVLAGRLSAAPGPDGRPEQRPVEVRPLVGGSAASLRSAS